MLKVGLLCSDIYQRKKQKLFCLTTHQKQKVKHPSKREPFRRRNSLNRSYTLSQLAKRTGMGRVRRGAPPLAPLSVPAKVSPEYKREQDAGGQHRYDHPYRRDHLQHLCSACRIRTRADPGTHHGRVGISTGAGQGRGTPLQDDTGQAPHGNGSDETPGNAGRRTLCRTRHQPSNAVQASHPYR